MNNVVHLPKLRIAVLDNDQFDEAARFLHQNWHETYHAALPAEILAERSLTYFQDYLNSRRDSCWLAWLDRRPVGLATLSANCVEDIWIGKDHRRRSIGTRLVDTVLNELRRRGFHSVQVGCEDFNKGAISFFAALGWKFLGAETVRLTPELRLQARVYGLTLA